MDFEELDEDAVAMAAAMGFSTFGSHKPPAKKRKFNPATDAFVSGQELEAIDRGGKKGQGSGGNTMPLGKMREFGTGKKVVSASEDEIDIDEGDGDEGTIQRVTTRREMNLPAVSGSEIKHQNELYARNNTRPLAKSNLGRMEDSSLPVRKAAENGGNEHEIDLDDDEEEEDIGANIIQEDVDGPAYIDTSHTPPAENVPLDPSDPEAIEMQARIDAILASIEEAPPPTKYPVPDGDVQGFLPPPTQQIFNHPGYGSRGRGAFSDTASITSSRPSHGERNPRWFEGYYDPSFNENPWKKLEAEKGLEAVGTWLELPNDRFRRP
jgi:hypothetical protein